MQIERIEQMPMVRIFFEKRSRAKYTSHLDVMRTMTRALRRSGLPLWYTQGFNPHLYMTFALPIALGCESLCESLDLRFTKVVPEEEIVARLNRALPPGFRALRAAAPVMDPGDIAWADYDVRLIYEEASPARMLEKLEVLLRQPEIQVSKRTKKGEKLLDIRPHVELLESEADERSLRLVLRLAAGNTLNIAPTLFLGEFYRWSGARPEGVRILRTAIRSAGLELFC